MTLVVQSKSTRCQALATARVQTSRRRATDDLLLGLGRARDRAADCVAARDQGISLVLAEGNEGDEPFSTYVRWVSEERSEGRRCRLDSNNRLIFNPGIARVESSRVTNFVVRDIPIYMHKARNLRELTPSWVLLLRRHHDYMLFSGPLDLPSNLMPSASCVLCSAAESRHLPQVAKGQAAFGCVRCACQWHGLCALYLRADVDLAGLNTFVCPMCLDD